MNGIAPIVLRNGEPFSLKNCPVLPFDLWRAGVLMELADGARTAALFLEPRGGPDRLHAILAGAKGELQWWITEVGTQYPSLTPECPQFHWFEREIAEQWGTRPLGHPWFKPIRFHRPYRPDIDAWHRLPDTLILPSVMDFFSVEGEEIHEVAVGPVHAGVIEPGHFRFQCHGETVLHLEISLGYQHRGVERALVGGPDPKTIHYMETLAGDTTVGHTTAYCQVVEALGDYRTSVETERLRAIALELERLANHTGDLGALAGDVGYLPTSSYCGRIRGDLLNMTALLCGNRFGRRLVRPGGIGTRIDRTALEELGSRLQRARKDLVSAVELLWRTPSVRARFENAGRVSRDTCLELGLVGVPARASGVERDVRSEYPTGAYAQRQIGMSTHPDGNVQARALVRWDEIKKSVDFIGAELSEIGLTEGTDAVATKRPRLAPEAGVVTLVEGWRGEICHVALTDSNGRFALYKVVDPSFHNWMGLAMALRNQQISDFPLCNKSFNLSYCGHDL